ncbi:MULTISPECIES: Bug family tripartite tricarboxylate transporter substrate binding protein [Achromobacter]|uniref:Tripartite tricarboxylate transporter substrate binding protein n=1 Tax=Achromobacter spanius TaxID=217203 RepID=A0ABY8GS28_9BURK|nr:MULTISPECIES: tripartite tricarboxylate transporter substrate binding protein [Achromobacter]WAI83345.1 tripartite tricarboxylate transporter substrate binding protein [Achromobacter spanius]WEX93431.1 tripartite tricarboxylate transporter substrate binding protein [Achromobacter sp. SS2-2022]WFP07411.1 tripartite tricarboxylate transporter substrate binding protein [Achromobacter spanius]
MKRFIAPLLLAATTAVMPVTSALAADAFPSARPITLVVPFPPGGPTDAMARRLAEKLREPLKQNVIVENRSGAGGNIGSEYVAGAKPDGYTILFGTSGPLAINVSLYKNQGYNPETSFAPIIRLGHLPNILVVNPSVPVKNVQELIAYAKQNPTKLSYASSGNGASSHLAGILFNKMAGTDIMHIPYKGTGPALNDLLGGQVSMSFTDILTALPHVKAGKLRAIGLASAQRSDALPDLPTLSEQGLKGYDVSVFFGIVAPKGTPADVVDTLNRAFKTALSDPAVEQALRSQGIVAAKDQTPQGLANFIAAEVPKWRELIKSANVSID